VDLGTGKPLLVASLLDVIRMKEASNRLKTERSYRRFARRSG
jgi:hypothetical protein